MLLTTGGMRSRVSRSRRLSIIASIAALCLAVFASAAGATTLHLFEKSVLYRVYGSAGQRLSSRAKGATGDSAIETDLDYIGTGKHHAKAATAIDHFFCYVVAWPKATCDGEFTFGRSVLSTDIFTENLSSLAAFYGVVIPIRQGTGRFRGAHGTIKQAQADKANDENLTLTYTK
jgi:hypothetical protein